MDTCGNQLRTFGTFIPVFLVSEFLKLFLKALLVLGIDALDFDVLEKVTGELLEETTGARTD
jgi:predicted DNA repair protein MutK